MATVHQDDDDDSPPRFTDEIEEEFVEEITKDESDVEEFRCVRTVTNTDEAGSSERQEIDYDEADGFQNLKRSVPNFDSDGDTESVTKRSRSDEFEKLEAQPVHKSVKRPASDSDSDDEGGTGTKRSRSNETEKFGAEPATREQHSVKRPASDSDLDGEADPGTKRTRRDEVGNFQRVPPPASLSTDVDNHANVVASHYNKLEEKGLAERSKSNILYLRNFNNWIKSVLINDFLTKVRETQKLGDPLRVLDMCCGKGGDLNKWKMANITHLICTDIAEISVKQCESRYQQMCDNARNQRNSFGKIFNAEFFTCDATLARLREHYKDPSIELNLVSCQFAFHYCFESLSQAECMIRNAAECLRTGGYFIGTIPDANDIVKRQRDAGDLSFGNSLYRITFQCDTEQPPLFGAKYNFELDGVVNCPEFLVYFPLLVKLARKYGLQLVMKERFEDYFQRHKESAKHLLQRMDALESYPSFNRRDAPESEFAHAKNVAKGRSCGTLSKSEWEASSLYMVFAFQKMKKVEYNNKGEPVYAEL